jgi:PAS domain S-box-containing protein
VEQEEPAFCPIVLIRHEKTDLRQESVDPSASDGRAHYDEVVDAPIDPAQLLQRLHSLLVRRRQSKELLQQISTLEEREQRLRLFEQGVESTGNGVVMTDTVGTIEYVNPAFASIAGYTEEEVLGASSQILLPGGSGKVFDEEFWRTIRDQGEWEGDIVIERKNSQRRVVNATATALRDADRETEGFVIVLKDITERIQREHELEDREEELDLLRQILTRHLRHNLRNDLTVIQGNAQMLVEDETLSPSQVELAETITEKSDVLIKTSETARTYSRLLERDVALSSFDMSELTMNAAQTVREEYSDVDFEIDVPETCPIQAREGIQRAVEELIENAARHNDARDPWVRIDVHDRDGARLLIEDNGPGISEQERDSLERGTETKLTHSQGVGLWLSKWVIEGVDGRLSIDTTDAGTRVRADFPATATVGSSGLTATTLKERERRLQTITDRMTDATLEIDAGWEITGLDTRAEGILDVNAGEVTGSSLWDVVPDLRGSHFETVVREAMESRSSMSVEEEFAGIDAWLEVNVYPEFNGGLSVYIRDVTDRIEREEALQDTKQRLETIIELSPEPVLALDSSGTVCVWNEAAEDVFGYTATDAIGERLESLRADGIR